MKVAIFTDTFTPNIDGVAVSIENALRILSTKGFEFLVVCPTWDGVDDRRKDATIVRLRSIALPQYKEYKLGLLSRRRCRKLIREFAPDLIHVETYGQVGRVAAVVGPKLGIPTLGTYHSLASEMDQYLTGPRKLQAAIRDKDTILQRFIWWLTVKQYNHCDLVTAPTPSIIKALKEHRLKPPAFPISNGITLSLFPMRDSFSTKPRRLVHVGRIGFEKRVDLILEAFSQVLKAVPDTKLDIIGGGAALERCKELAKELRIDQAVTFHGYLPRKTLYKEYHKADVFVTASPMETQGIVMLEAMACGLPCVGINRYAVPDTIMHGKNGYIAKEPHATNIAKHVIKLLTIPGLVEKLGRTARKKAEKNEIGLCVEQLGKTYTKMVKTR